MKIRHLPDGSLLCLDVHGVMLASELTPGVLLHVRQGVMNADFAQYVKQDCERQLRKAGRCVLMVDGYETKMHTTEFRETMTTWFRDRENAVVHMLVRSRMVEMALNVANLVMGAQRAKIYLDVEEWEAVGRAEFPSFVRRPLVLPEEVLLDRS